MNRMRILIFTFSFLSILTGISAQNYENPRTVSGVVLLGNTQPLDVSALMASIKSDWKFNYTDYTTAEKTIVISGPGCTIMIGQLAYPADPIELRAAAQLSWLWPTATEEALRHKAQAVISVIGPGARSLDLHQIFTKIAAAVMESAPAAGIYMNGQYLLLSKGFYCAAAHNMLDNQTIPAYCWVYFGAPGNGGAYTFGMSDFGLKEMEIVQSAHSNADIQAVIYEAAIAVIKYNTQPKDGESIVTEEGSKLRVKWTKGVFVQGLDVLKLEY